MSVSKPMKLIALRMDEEEKERLEQLAAERHLTLSTVLREGAKLYLGEVRGSIHRKKGEPVTWLDVRRRKDGTSVGDPIAPTKRQAEHIAALRAALEERGLGSIRESWDAGAAPSVVVAAIAQWLQTIGTLYCREPSRWDVFLADYTNEYDDEEKVDRLRLELRRALTDGVTLNPSRLLDMLGDAVDWLFRDLEAHESVRHHVLLEWGIFRRERKAAPASRHVPALPVAEWAT